MAEPKKNQVLLSVKIFVNLVMRSSKIKVKRNLAIPGEPMSQGEFEALIKEAEKGPFKPLDSFDEFRKDIVSTWEKKYGK